MHALLRDDYVVGESLLVRKQLPLLDHLGGLPRGAVLSLLTNGRELFELPVGVQVRVPGRLGLPF